MAKNRQYFKRKKGFLGARASNVKSSPKYDRFGETIRYLTLDELQKLFDSIEDYRHKLMFRIIYQLGCRVGEFVRIQLKHLDFGRSMVLFPAENTKTGKRRNSFLPQGTMNEVISLLRAEGRMNKRTLQIRKPESYLFHPPGRINSHYTENRLRQLFRKYADLAGFNQTYGTDTQGRTLHQFTVHSIRHAHIMGHIHHYKLPLSIVQKQVGHRSLRSTSVYLNPSEEAVAEAYSQAHCEPRQAPASPATYRDKKAYKL